MGKYDNDVKELLAGVGGKENIAAVSHCMTRMRFALNDPKKADEAKIGEIAAVKGKFTQAGQFQVIIGNDVGVFYNEFSAYAGIEGVSKDAVKSAAKTNQNVLQRIMGALGEIFAPIIPAIICGGLILGFRNVIGEIKLCNNGTQTLIEISQFWAGMHSFLWLIGEAIFHMLPVGIVWSITRKMGTTQILGIVLGLTLVSPQLLNGFAVASTAPGDIPFWDFGFFHVSMIGYQGQVIAAIMAGFVLVYLEKFLKKICPEVISMIIVPFFALVPAVIIGHVLVGPIGWIIGNGIANVVYAGLTSKVGWLFAGLFGVLYAPVVMTGLHHMTNAIDSQLIASFNGTILWPMIALSNIAQGSSVVAMHLLQKKNKKATGINVPAWISCYLGVTEPALFGVNMKYGFPLICGMIGSGIAAMVSVGTGVKAVSIGVGGLPGILSIYSQFWVMFLLAMAIAMGVPFALTYIVGMKRLSAKDRGLEPESPAEAEKSVKILSPLAGKIVQLAEVNDEAFSSGVLGKGIAILPEKGVLVSPVNGTVDSLTDSKHAITLVGNSGEEILIHIGMDTVTLKGKPFTPKVKEGDAVTIGQPLIEFDIQAIKDAGLETITPIVLANSDDYGSVIVTQNGNVAAGDTIITLEA
jgi:PTS system trehalose-specific IIC component